MASFPDASAVAGGGAAGGFQPNVSQSSFNRSQSSGKSSLSSRGSHRLTASSTLSTLSTLSSKALFTVYEFLKNLTYTQRAFLIVFLFVAIWGAVVSVLLLDGAHHYIFTTSIQDRVAYVSAGAAAWARAEAEGMLGAANEARLALRAAVRGQTVASSKDLAALEQVLAPTFASAPHLRDVVLAFPGETSVLSVGHSGPGNGMLTVQMHSNADDCYLLGLEGCFPEAQYPPNRMPEWYWQTMLLPAGAGQEGVEADDHFQYPGDAFTWGSAPEMVMERGVGSEWHRQTWFPTYQLYFRLADSEVVSEDTRDGTALIGKINLGVGLLSKARLQDKQMGDESRVYLCDREGYVLSSADPEDVIVVSKTSGLVYPRRLGNGILDAEVAEVKQALFSGKDLDRAYEDGSYVSVKFLKEPLGHFAVVAHTPPAGPLEQTPFAHAALHSLSIVSLVIVLGSYCAVFVVLNVSCRRYASYRLANSKLVRSKSYRRLMRALRCFSCQGRKKKGADLDPDIGGTQSVVEGRASSFARLSLKAKGAFAKATGRGTGVVAAAPDGESSQDEGSTGPPSPALEALEAPRGERPRSLTALSDR